MARPRKPRPPQGYCKHCGAPLLERALINKKTGRIKEYRTPKVFCSLRCTGLAAHETQFKKRRGWSLDKHGYVILSRAGKSGYGQPEHRAVMEAMLGRKLEPHETVHHKNGIRSDNRPENLELWNGRHGRGHRADDEDIWSGMIPAYQHNAV